MTSFPLHLLRHGEPSLTGRLLGRTDSPATPGGVRACAAQASGVAAERLVSSDLARARACAEAIGEPTVDPRWRELEFGEWDGRAAAEIDPAALGRFWEDPDAFPPPGGERWSMLVARVGEAMDALAPVPTLVVTHGGPIRAALHHLCGFAPAETWSFDLPYAAMLSLRVWTGERRRAQITALRP